MNIENQINEILLTGGASLVGFADLTCLPADVRLGLPFGIAMAVALDAEAIAGVHEGPTKEYYAEYQRVNRILSTLSYRVANHLQEKGFKAQGFAATDEGVDPETHSTRLPHKTVATRAGLGWIGKCALLVTKQFGSAIRLNKVLTDAPLPPGVPVNVSECGDCMACVSSCPAQAPVGKAWSPGIERAEIFDAFACRATARRLAQERTGVEDTFCGICMAVCPWTRKYIKDHTR